MKIYFKSNFSIFIHTKRYKLHLGPKFLFTNYLQFCKFDTEAKKITLNYLNQENTSTNLPKLKEIEDNELIFKEAKSFIRDDSKNKFENLLAFRKHIELEHKKHKAKTYHKSKIGLGLLVLLIGLFSLWVPLYRVICESQGFSVKTTHTDYKFDGKECK
jgi:hypothetical protein